MKITERLQTVTKLFLDTAPVVYYVEGTGHSALHIESKESRLELKWLVMGRGKAGSR